jgi:uncharacterized membrane protein YphA (DoxX/SURF4 family)
MKVVHERFQPVLTLLARFILGGVLLFAGGLKLFEPTDSANAVAAYKLLPSDLSRLVGYALPWLEVALALLLILGFLVGPAAVVSGLIMIVFIGAIASVWARGILIDCGCFGGGGEIDPTLASQVHRTYFIEIMRDFGLALTAVYLYFFPCGKFSIEKAIPATKE